MPIHYFGITVGINNVMIPTRKTVREVLYRPYESKGPLKMSINYFSICYDDDRSFILPQY